MIRCAIYTSTHAGSDTTQTELHIIQRMAARVFIAQRERHGWTCVRTYQDVAPYGSHMNRPALQQLLADIAAGHLDCVVVESLERLARKGCDQARLFHKFRRRGVTLAIVCPGDGNVLGRTREGIATFGQRKQRRSDRKR